LVLHVAARIGDARRLALLYLLTVADARATGPSAWSPWRLGLVKELVARVQSAFERGLMDAGRASLLRRAEARVREGLADTHPAEATGFLERVPPDYLLWVDPTWVGEHLALI